MILPVEFLETQISSSVWTICSSLSASLDPRTQKWQVNPPRAWTHVESVSPRSPVSKGVDGTGQGSDKRSGDVCEAPMSTRAHSLRLDPPPRSGPWTSFSSFTMAARRRDDGVCACVPRTKERALMARKIFPVVLKEKTLATGRCLPVKSYAGLAVARQHPLLRCPPPAAQPLSLSPSPSLFHPPPSPPARPQVISRPSISMKESVRLALFRIAVRLNEVHYRRIDLAGSEATILEAVNFYLQAQNKEAMEKLDVYMARLRQSVDVIKDLQAATDEIFDELGNNAEMAVESIDAVTFHTLWMFERERGGGDAPI
ncbi:hypothetical protein BDK51DRAFT_38997 [Blyttiomyces helicus]|uniref:Uncharacterized protein n=1 Tax=Blyttiomyces helicus TaxID=388810 RepID=A0A4P9WCR0_9FUNG|nr:hypothetical protein BDK51DRAFT_38997 [Blyttiomyces helicus]|eukprot:RKO89008.1 hypothetical protein BDK51DRAFT_38997 [Blyttiomyces helicus]